VGGLPPKPALRFKLSAAGRYQPPTRVKRDKIKVTHYAGVFPACDLSRIAIPWSATVADRIVNEELELLRRVIDAVDQTPANSAPSEDSLVEELERIRQALVEGTDTKDEGALMQQWDRQSALLKQLRESRKAPLVDRNSPYFGHLHLREGKRDVDLCLGKATLIRGGVSIVDWRHAPISSIFYRYKQGDEYDEEIAGRTRSGTVVARRTVAIRDRRLERVEAPEGVFSAEDGAWRHVRREPPRLAGGEGAALRVHDMDDGADRRLGTHPGGVRHRADKRLPDIAGLIDPEQFDLITRPSSGLVVIRGTAGSGKTTVALHRIAYLAYADASIETDDTLFIVFSPALRNYVSHVLPALGIDGVAVKTFQEWAAAARRRLLPKLPRDVRDSAPAVVQRLKLHPAMLAALAEQVKNVPGRANAAQVIDDWGSVLCQRRILEDVFGRVSPGAFSADELRRAADWNRERYEELGAWLRGDQSVQAELDAEDDALLLRAWQLRVGPLLRRDGTPLRCRHIAIDEVQDFSPLEVRVLLDCLDEHRSMTLAGDTQQHIVQGGGFTSWQDFFAQLGIEGTAVDTLRVSYRSTREIANFALAVLGDLREDEAPPLTTRSGPAVEMFRFTEHGACVAFLAEALRDLTKHEPLASVAVLTPSPTLSEMYYESLARTELAELRWVRNQDFNFTPGIEVTEIEQVKGLEFDYVVLVEVSMGHFPETPSARRLLHVGASRAIHQLWLTSVGTPSRLVTASLDTDAQDK
jgi:DNA helicase-2/ATP-dependent DNA helicase PcrA